MADIMQIPEKHRVAFCEKLIEEVQDMEPMELAAMMLETMDDDEIAMRLYELEHPDRVVN
jgi:hypothetical protein